MQETELKELIDALKPLITPQGLIMSGNGIIINNQQKIIDLLDRQNFLLSKIEKHLYSGSA